MNIVCVLNHPAHYYLFKNIISQLRKKSHNVDILIKEKDILEDLLKSEQQEFKKICIRINRSKNIFSIFFSSIIELIIQNFNLYVYILKKKKNPDALIGTDISITHIGKLFSIPSFVFNEDDFEINKLFCKTSYPFATAIVSPDYTSVGKYIHKKISYNGIQKMAYLHEDYFKPDPSILKKLSISKTEKFFIIRLVSLTSGHDIEGKHSGISLIMIKKLISFLENYGKVFITSESTIDSEFSNYIVNIMPNEMHSLMYYSSFFIGDSQTMCAEAGILGVPFIRFNDFVGKINYLNDIENNYKLGWGVKTNNPDKVFEILKSHFKSKNHKDIWKKNVKKLFNDKIDLNSLCVWLIENYPHSISSLKSNKISINKFKFK